MPYLCIYMLRGDTREKCNFYYEIIMYIYLQEQHIEMLECEKLKSNLSINKDRRHPDILRCGGLQQELSFGHIT